MLKSTGTYLGPCSAIGGNGSGEPSVGGLMQPGFRFVDGSLLLTAPDWGPAHTVMHDTSPYSPPPVYFRRSTRKLDGQIADALDAPTEIDNTGHYGTILTHKQMRRLRQRAAVAPGDRAPQLVAALDLLLRVDRLNHLARQIAAQSMRSISPQLIIDRANERLGQAPIAHHQVEETDSGIMVTLSRVTTIDQFEPPDPTDPGPPLPVLARLPGTLGTAPG